MEVSKKHRDNYTIHEWRLSLLVTSTSSPFFFFSLSSRNVLLFFAFHFFITHSQCKQKHGYVHQIMQPFGRRVILSGNAEINSILLETEEKPDVLSLSYVFLFLFSLVFFLPSFSPFFDSLSLSLSLFLSSSIHLSPILSSPFLVVMCPFSPLLSTFKVLPRVWPSTWIKFSFQHYERCELEGRHPFVSFLLFLSSCTPLFTFRSYGEPSLILSHKLPFATNFPCLMKSLVHFIFFCVSSSLFLLV